MEQTVVLLLLLVAAVHFVATNPDPDYFCEHFYTNISSRDPHRFYVNDNAPEGTIIKEFPRHSHERNTVSFTAGDLNFIDFDRKKFAIVTKTPLYEKADQTLQIMGNCSEFIKRINYGFVLPLSVLVEVRDVNDPPVFGNLPANLRIKESVRVGSLLYKVVMKQGFDVRDEFSANIFRLTAVKAEGHPEFNAARFFSLDTDGNVHLIQPIDYETNPRKFELTIQAQDLAEPPLSNTETLTFYIQDIDDMKPRFQHKHHTSTMVGERPVKNTECWKTEPTVFAEDQDIRAKAKVHYSIISGEPGLESEWRKLFKLEESTGQICQISTIHRTFPDPETGRLTFTNYTFNIKAYQVDNPRKYDTATLDVHVADSNKHAPKFNRKLYRTSVKEHPEIKEGQEVLQVKAEDKDHGQNAVFRYQLEGAASQWFNIHPDTGWITVADPTRFDRELYSHFEFKVKAIETSTLERLESIARVMVQIEDINDNAPEFNRYRYTYTVKDTHRPGLVIHSSNDAVLANDRDSGENGRMLYKITGVWRGDGMASFTDSGRFFIDPEEGSIKLAGTLNDLRRRRDHPEFRLQVSATDQAQEKADRKSASVDVIIRVVEANDFIPIVTPKRGPVFVNESEPIGSTIYKIKVADKDGDEDVYLRQEIKHGNKGGVFKISNSGRVTIHKPLDREKTDAYKLKIEVSDGKNVATTTLKVQVLDSNDNNPTFSQDEYVFSIMEEPAQGTLICKLKAEDMDGGPSGMVKYSLKETTGSDLFSINSMGEIYVENSRSPLLDREQNTAILLRVLASDMGNPPLSSVADVRINLVDGNDNSPLFTSPVYHGWIEEDDNKPRPQVVTMDIPINATDLDAGQGNRNIRYSLVGEGSQVFRMDPIRADIITADIGNMDAERRQSYKLTVRAQDQLGKGLVTEADVLIEVKDLNDNAPQFLGRQHFSALTNAPPGKKIGNLRASDRDVTQPNNQVIFILKDGGNGKFTVDFQTGEIKLVERLDKEPMLAEYRLNIQALDGGSPRMSNLTSVVINVPINRPPIISNESTQLQVKEDLPPGSVVGALRAQDLDDVNGIGNNLQFFLMDNKVPFEVSPQGLITTKDFLDRELHQKYEFQLYVKDEGSPPLTSSARVTVVIDDVNDHAPEFINLPYEGTVVEDDSDPKPGQPVKMNINITTLDRDATAGPSDVRYSLHGKHSDMFAIDHLTAHIRVSQLGYGRIDREQVESYTLKVRATDNMGQGISNEADLVIRVVDVNDARPHFRKQKKPLVVTETVEVGQVIGKLDAHDSDATEPNNMIIYTLENDPYGKFSVDSHTGEIRALTGVFYPPRQLSYELRVAATDMGYPPLRSETRVEIKMNKTNFNDFKPEFLGDNIFYVHEQVPIGTLIGTITIQDDDVGNGEAVTLTLENKDGDHVPFTINDKTGEIRNTHVLDFDRGTRAYTFNVVARDKGDPPKSARVSIGVILDDVNDNPPRFTQKGYHHKVSDMFPAGTIVATPFAYDDVDSGNSEYLYSMKGPDVGMYFTIDRRTGIVRTTEHLPNMIEDKVMYTLVASDIYNERLKAQAELVIDIYHQRGGGKCCCKVPCASMTSSSGRP